MTDRSAVSEAVLDAAPGRAAVSEAVLDAAPGQALEAAPEREIAADMVRRSVLFAVPLVGVSALVWGWSGAASAGLALALVLVNFVLGAAAITWGARIGGSAMMGMVMGGYVLHLGIVTAAVLPIRHHHWFELLPFAASLLIAHVGLLVVECRYVAASAAFPGLKPGEGFLSRRSPSSRRPSLPLERSA